MLLNAFRPTFPRARVDPFELFFDTTMAGGTSLFGDVMIDFVASRERFDDLVAVRAEVLLDYERTISDLRRELLYYKRLIAQMVGPTDIGEDYGQTDTVIPVDAISVRIVNSIVLARVPPSATFRDFDEGEL
jgi:hypothetical protein